MTIDDRGLDPELVTHMQAQLHTQSAVACAVPIFSDPLDAHAGVVRPQAPARKYTIYTAIPALD